MTGDETRFTVNSPNATDEELVALFVVLKARSANNKLKEGADRPLAGGWKSYYRTVRQPPVSGREAWRNPIRF